MIKSLWACWIDESPQWNLICFQVVRSSVLCMHCNELNLQFLKKPLMLHITRSLTRIMERQLFFLVNLLS